MLRLVDGTLCRDGQIILEHVNLTLGQGELIVLIGPNGAGKSTAMKTMLGPVSYTHLTLPTKRIV